MFYLLVVQFLFSLRNFSSMCECFILMLILIHKFWKFYLDYVYFLKILYAQFIKPFGITHFFLHIIQLTYFLM